MAPSEKRIVELSTQDRHILERIAKELEKRNRPLTQQAMEERRRLYESLTGEKLLPEFDAPEPPRDEGDFLTLGPELFASPDRNVISYKGDNFYKACGEFVRKTVDGGETHCIKRVGHARSFEHEDYDGRINTGFASD